MKTLTKDEKIAVAMLMGEATATCGLCHGKGVHVSPWGHKPCHMCMSTGKFLGNKVKEAIMEIEANG